MNLTRTYMQCASLTKVKHDLMWAPTLVVEVSCQQLSLISCVCKSHTILVVY